MSGSCYKLSPPKLRIFSFPQMLCLLLRTLGSLLGNLCVEPKHNTPVARLPLSWTKLFPSLEVQATFMFDINFKFSFTELGWG